VFDDVDDFPLIVEVVPKQTVKQEKEETEAAKKQVDKEKDNEKKERKTESSMKHKTIKREENDEDGDDVEFNLTFSQDSSKRKEVVEDDVVFNTQAEDSSSPTPSPSPSLHRLFAADKEVLSQDPNVVQSVPVSDSVLSSQVEVEIEVCVVVRKGSCLIMMVYMSC
jgi:hypothetical protein